MCLVYAAFTVFLSSFFVYLLYHSVAAASKMFLCVILSSQDLRRVTLDCVPESVKELCETLRTSLGLRENFVLQFEDPDFGNELCNLTDIKDLASGQATLKVLFTL